MPMPTIDMTGFRRGRLEVLRRVTEEEKKARYTGWLPPDVCWFMQCDCGNTLVFPGSTIRKSGRSDCGCEACFNAFYYRYNEGALKRNLEWELDRAQFRALTQGDCFYCGVSPSYKFNNGWINRYGAFYLCNGVDRRDSAIGYTVANCVPACKRCNLMKRDIPEDEFISHCARVAGHSLC